MARHIVAAVREIPPGERKLVELEGRSIGVFNIGGEFYALRNRCPHQGGPMCAGELTGFTIADAPRAYRYERKGEILRCPWHNWEFDVKTGQSWVDPARVRVRAYDTLVARGGDLQAAGASAVQPGTSAAQPGTSAAQPDASAVQSGPHPVQAPAVNPETADAQAGGRQPGPYTAETYSTAVEEEFVVVDLG